MVRELDVLRTEARTVRVRHAGNAGDPLVVYAHGAPSSRLEITYGEDRCERLGVQLAGFDRPGFGGSGFMPFTHASVTEDAMAVADALGVERFAVLGSSAGSSYVLHAGLTHPDRVAAVGVSSGGCPIPEVPDVVAQLSEGEQRGLALIGTDDAEAERLLAEADVPFVDVLSLDDAALISFWCDHCGEADVRALEDEQLAGTLARAHREALRQGQAGWARDNLVRCGPWDFDVSQVSVPTYLWYGEQDVVAYGTWIAERVHGSVLTVRPGEAHFQGFTHWDEMMTTLAAHVAPASAPAPRA